MPDRPLVMIPGPIEVSPAVQAACDGPPPAHTAAPLIAAFGQALGDMRRVWKAPDDAAPFVVAGSGTLAMEMAVQNLLDPGQHAVVVDTGYFSDRMAKMLDRRGVAVRRVTAEPGDAPRPEAVARALAEGPTHAVFVTHVDTSTGVRVDLPALAPAIRAAGALWVVDGVCATAGEAFDMAGLGADVYLTASQKAVGLPPGLALLVASARALDARRRLSVPPALVLDLEEWAPIMRAYEEGRPSYFATPATGLVRGLAVGLREIVEATEGETTGVDAAVARHARGARAMRAAWAALGLTPVPRDPGLAAHTLSALWLPEGVDATLPAKVAARGVLVAGGLHPAIRTRYFRVGHMGWVLTRPDLLARTVRAIGGALAEAGHPADAEAAVAALSAALAG